MELEKGQNGLVEKESEVLVVDKRDQMLISMGSQGVGGVGQEKGDICFSTDRLGEPAQVSLDQNF